MNYLFINKHFNIIIILFSAIFDKFVISSMISNNDTLSDQFDGYIRLISNVKKLYNIRNIRIAYTDNLENFFLSSLMLSYLKQSPTNSEIPQIIKLSNLSSKYKKFSESSWQLIVVLIKTEDDLKSFETFTKIHRLTSHLWFIIFWGSPPNEKLKSFCDKPSGNRFNLNFDARILIKCYDSCKIQEWYSTRKRNVTLVYDLMEWRVNSGLIIKSKESVYQRRHDFSGELLKLAAVQDRYIQPSFDGDNLKNADIFQLTIVEILRHMKFQVKILPPSDVYGVFNETGNEWTGLLGKIMSGKVDVAFAGFKMSSERSESFDFTWPLRSGRNLLYIKKPEFTQIKWNAYIKAFYYDVLIAFAALIIIVPMLLTFIKAKINSNQFQGTNNFVENFVHTWGIYCQQGLPNFPRSSSLRIIIVLMFVSNLIFLSIYSAFVISYLMNSAIILPFNSLLEFVKDGTYKFSVIRGGSEETLFSVTKDPVLSRMKLLMKPRLEFPTKNVDGFKQLCTNKKTAYYVTEGKLHFAKHNVSCQLTSIVADRTLFVSLPLSKNNPLKYFMNYYIQRFKENGIISRIKILNADLEEIADTTFHAVGIGEITPALMIVLFGLILSIAILILELFNYKYRIF